MGSLRVKPEEVKEFYRLYQVHGTYAAVARETGRSASTVAKYIKARNLKALSMAGTQEFNK